MKKYSWVTLLIVVFAFITFALVLSKNGDVRGRFMVAAEGINFLKCEAARAVAVLPWRI